MPQPFEVNIKEIMGETDEGLGKRITDEIYKEGSDNLTTTHSERQGSSPYDFTIFSMADLLQGKPAYGSIEETLGRFETTLSSALSGFVGQIEDSPVLNNLLPDDIHAMLAANSPDAPEDGGDGSSGREGGANGGRAGSAPTEAKEIISLAKNEVGYAESPPGSNKTKFAQIAGVQNGLAWCSTFIKAMFVKAGHPQSTLVTPSTEATLDNFMRINKVGKTPKVGALVFFLFPGSRSRGRRVNHIGIVYDWDDQHVLSIDGNTSGDNERNGGQVAKRTRPRGSNSQVKYYAYPDYTDVSGGGGNAPPGQTR